MQQQNNIAQHGHRESTVMGTYSTGTILYAEATGDRSRMNWESHSKGWSGRLMAASVSPSISAGTSSWAQPNSMAVADYVTAVVDGACTRGSCQRDACTAVTVGKVSVSEGAQHHVRRTHEGTRVQGQGAPAVTPPTPTR